YMAATTGFASFLGSPLLFADYVDAHRFLRLERTQASFIVLHVAPGHDPAAVRDALHARLTDVDIWHSAEFARKSRLFWLVQPGAGGALTIAAIGFRHRPRPGGTGDLQHHGREHRGIRHHEGDGRVQRRRAHRRSGPVADLRYCRRTLRTPRRSALRHRVAFDGELVVRSILDVLRRRRRARAALHPRFADCCAA